MWTKARSIAARKSSGMVLKSYYRLTQKRATSKAKSLVQTACSRAWDGGLKTPRACSGSSARGTKVLRENRRLLSMKRRAR